MSIFFHFCHNVLKSRLLQMRQNVSTCGKGLISFESLNQYINSGPQVRLAMPNCAASINSLYYYYYYYYYFNTQF